MDVHPNKKIFVAFFKNENGGEPVKDWLLSLSKTDRQIIGADIKTVEIGWPKGMPLVRPLSNTKALREVRSNLPGGRIARMIFMLIGNQMILLHGFIKKSQKTPTPDLKIAKDRQKLVNSNPGAHL